MSISSVNRGSNVGLSATTHARVSRNDDGDDRQNRGNGRVKDSFHSDFKSLLKAITSGDITTAQSALASLESDVGSTSATYTPSSTAPASPGASLSSAPDTSKISTDLKAIFDAVGSGDIDAARSALSTFRLDSRGPQQAHANSSGVSGAHGKHGHYRNHQLESVIASIFSSASNVVTSTDPTTIPDATSSDVTSSDVTSSEVTSSEVTPLGATAGGDVSSETSSAAA